MVLRERHRRAGVAGDRMRGRARRLADRRQYLDARCLLPLARPARPAPGRPQGRPAARGAEPGLAATASCTICAATAGWAVDRDVLAGPA
jgi:hypothetical protein